MIGNVIKIKEDALSAASEAMSTEKRAAPSLKDRFIELRSLDCFDMVRSRLVHGHSPFEVAKYIVEESGEFSKFTRIKTIAGLKDLLNDFRGELKSSEIVSRVIPEAVKGIMEKMDKGVNELDELQYLYLLQKDRIEIDYATEKKINKLFKSTGNEVVVAMGLLKLMANLKQDLGLMKRDLGTLEVDHTLLAELPYKSKAVEEVMSDPSSRAKVVGLVRRMFSRPDLMGAMFATVKDAREAVVTDVEVVEDKKETPDAHP